MKHTIIIPHRNRLAHLGDCLASIERSAASLGLSTTDFEVVIAHAGRHAEISTGIPQWGFIGELVCHEAPMPVFNKSKLLNLGIEAAEGDVLTFLDADMIVGPRWLEGVDLLGRDLLTERRLSRLCYRVRNAPPGVAPADEMFAEPAWSRLERGYEAYGNPGFNATAGQEPPNQEPWGNSQFSIPREVLGDLRFDEGYEGRGFEDLDFLYRLWGRDKRGYHAALLTDGPHALLHQAHGHAADWKTDEIVSRNLRRFLPLKMRV